MISTFYKVAFGYLHKNAKWREGIADKVKSVRLSVLP